MTPVGEETMVELCGVTKTFGAVSAVSDVSLKVRAGELITLLGPSGCGKTTLLRLISGLETPTAGRIFIAGKDVTHDPPYRRDTHQVFQSYALFPHLSVRENIGFGLRMKKVPRRDAEERVREAIAMVSLEGMEDRKPSQLSGGQRQRVALARALVCRPKVLLLDEPLSALDAQLRRAMQVELKRLQQKVGITFVLVTHDQEEALTLSDRIVVLHQGRIEQIGDASSLYHRPRTTFVASFIGQANLFEGTVTARDGRRATLRLGPELDVTLFADDLPANAATARVSIRPESIRIGEAPETSVNVFEAEIVERIFKGATDQLLLRTPGGVELWAVAPSGGQAALRRGDRVRCHLRGEDVVLLPGE